MLCEKGWLWQPVGGCEAFHLQASTAMDTIKKMCPEVRQEDKTHTFGGENRLMVNPNATHELRRTQSPVLGQKPRAGHQPWATWMFLQSGRKEG